ncbi:molybdenum cofactor guanylyltransferase [Dehalogenimonas sp. THU2]|uniref:molybdenum cofactor guanylyltransferase n=1 Tax=Dehalogenimonas sp. THU2 TaxID=3151121 RepID=UPI003218386D
MDLSCIVLAGGRGLRLGRNKALEAIGTQTLVQRTVSSLIFCDTEIIVVTGPHNTELGLEEFGHVRLVIDAFPGRGPLVGIYTGLLNSRADKNLVVACDMPFLNPKLLRYMAEISEGYDAVVPRVERNVEPLHAIYGKECLTQAKYLLDDGIYSVTELFKRIRVRYVEADEIDRFDPEHLSFFNINNEADLTRAREIEQKERLAMAGSDPGGFIPGSSTY